MNRTLIMIFFLGAIVVVGVAATTAPKGSFKNLQVLPDTISEKQLSSIMINDFDDGLGVTCAFCHAKEKDSEKLDYASDDNPMKNNARMMMRMVTGINKDYFKMKNPMVGDSSLQVTCVTCHNSKPYPGE